MSFEEALPICAASVFACVAALLVLLWDLRRNGPSFGLPFAYLTLLALNHVPGAAVPLIDHEFYIHMSEVTLGIMYTAIGMVSFVFAVWYARHTTNEQRLKPQLPSYVASPPQDTSFWIFCILGGWFFTFGLLPLRSIPSVGAVVYNGGAIWMLGCLLALRWSVRNSRHGWTLIWMVCLAVYPALVLVTWGFLSYGTSAAMIVLSVLAVSARKYWRVIVAISLITYLGLSLFSNYFQLRDNIRDVIWTGASTERRIGAIAEVFKRWEFFDASDQLVLVGLDLRLNQNYFIGLAAENLQRGDVDYLWGSSVSDALLAVVPRAIWPSKSVFAGSPAVVEKMTGLELEVNTSFGVGNVMEFYINFGTVGVIVGFLALGWAIGRFDHRAALAETRGDYSTAIVFFLPAVALIQPVGSMVELTSGAASAWVAGYVWKFLWERAQGKDSRRDKPLTSKSPAE